MKNFFLIICILGLVGCTTAQPYVSNNTDLGTVNFEDLLWQKSGKSCNTWLFGFIPKNTDYASIAKAAWDAGIKKVSYVEGYKESFFPIWSSDCVVVYGE